MHKLTLTQNRGLMVSLRDYQKKFLESYHDESSFIDLIKADQVSASNRLSVYHTSIRETLRKALTLTYPLTWKLIGEECANGAAYAFIQEKVALPQTGNLDEWGETFPKFLSVYPPLQTLSYLPEFAHLEWLQHLAYNAPDKEPLTIQAFKGLPPESYEKLSLELHPSVHLFSSSYPLDQIFAVVNEKVDTITLENRKSYALIIRPYKTVIIHWLPEASFSFFSLLKKGLSLLQVMSQIEDETFQLNQTLSFAFQAGLFSDHNLKIHESKDFVEDEA
ncbi:MAG: putative DNA-binding domain-containing protein [Proteobacteria bacterium]|nr:putative DNA-binding domain-containing protein [Pseudomonadota bacterium]